MAADHRLLVLQNAYRVLGIPATASGTDIRKAAERAKMRARVGARFQGFDPFAGLPCDRSESAVQDALGKLLVPAPRLKERLFWVHNELDDFDPAADLLAGDLGPAAALCSYLYQDDACWEALLASDPVSPKAGRSDADRLRRDLPELLLSSVAASVANALAAGDTAKARGLLEFFRDNQFPPHLNTEYCRRAIEPLLQRLTAAVSAIGRGEQRTRLLRILEAGELWDAIVFLGVEKQGEELKEKLLQAALRQLYERFDDWELWNRARGVMRRLAEGTSFISRVPPRRSAPAAAPVTPQPIAPAKPGVQPAVPPVQPPVLQSVSGVALGSQASRRTVAEHRMPPVESSRSAWVLFSLTLLVLVLIRLVLTDGAAGPGRSRSLQAKPNPAAINEPQPQEHSVQVSEQPRRRLRLSEVEAQGAVQEVVHASPVVPRALTDEEIMALEEAEQEFEQLELDDEDDREALESGEDDEAAYDAEPEADADAGEYEGEEW